MKNKIANDKKYFRFQRETVNTLVLAPIARGNTSHISKTKKKKLISPFKPRLKYNENYEHNNAETNWCLGKFWFHCLLANVWCHSIVPLIFIFWNVNEKHFTYAGFDHFSILISFYQSCWSYVFLFVVWDLLGKELTHICLCVWWQWINKTVAPLVW